MGLPQFRSTPRIFVIRQTEFDPVRQRFWENKLDFYEYKPAGYPTRPVEPPHSLLETLWVEAVKEVKALELKFE